MDDGFKLQYIYCWLHFIRDFNSPLYLSDTVVLENLNTITFNKGQDNELTLYFESGLEVIDTLMENDQLWLDVVQEELDLSIEDYRAEILNSIDTEDSAK